MLRRAALLRMVSIAAVCALAGTAGAGPSEDAAKAVKQGSELAKADDFAGAVAAFKRADALLERAEHACLIALAYLRQGAIGQAELHFQRCKTRASGRDPFPGWGPGLEKKLAAQLAAWTALEIAVIPSRADGVVELSVSTYAADEIFAPRVIYVRPGPLSLIVKETGRAPITKDLVVPAGPSHKLTIDLRAEAEAARAAANAAQPLDQPTSGDARPAGSATAAGPGGPLAQAAGRPDEGGSGHRRGLTPASGLAFGAAGAALITGVAFHTLALSSRAKLEDAVTDQAYRLHEDEFDSRRTFTFVSYGIAATAATIGLLLALRKAPAEHSAAAGLARASRPQPSAQPRISAGLLPAGGMLVLEWSR